jgi:TolB-like protein/DNA-binding winged helix-turn-helix (wHTH) protein/cytochrome c-type biogenesis protein CcmH/NrfG
MPAQESSSVVQIGEWTVHPALDTISRGAETQKLEPRTMRLLMCLANSAGDVVSIDRLLTEVWAGVVVGPASVYEAVSQLRKILGDVDSKPTYIATVPRKGYRLIASVQRGTAPAETTEAATMQRETASPRRVWVVAAPFAVLLALIAAYFLTDVAWLSKYAAGKGQTHAASVVVGDKSIAVLPFTDMSEKKDQEYFADGMAEEIINLLVKVPGLKVISRTSSFQFKGKTEDLRAIGTQLGVVYLLEGSVRKSGDRLRVTAQLVDSRDGNQLWSQTYDRDLSDVLKMQDEIAASLVRALQIEVTASLFVSRPALRNAEAYTLYLKGLHALDRFDQQGLEQAASDFQRALHLDPTFAAAAGNLADVYFFLGVFGSMSSWVEQARNAAESALKLDPNHAGAHAVLGNIDLVYWDWPGADRELNRARALAPNDARILFASAVYSQIMGRWGDALKLANTCLEEDPLDPRCNLLLSRIQASQGRSADAEAAAHRALEISPTANTAHRTLGEVLLARKQPEAALAEFLKEPYEADHLDGSAMAYFAMGRRTDSDAALAQVTNSHPDDAFGIAEIYAFRGESDEAFKWLNRSYAQKDTRLSFIKGDRLFKNVEGDPRYKALLKKMNLPE